MCVHFISEFDFFAILNFQLCNRNKVTSKNIYYVSVSSIQFNEQDSLQLNLEFSQTVHLTAVKLTLTRNFNGHWFYFLQVQVSNRLNERLCAERSLHESNNRDQNQRLAAYPFMGYRWSTHREIFLKS